jgi:hypothetical protein
VPHQLLSVEVGQWPIRGSNSLERCQRSGLLAEVKRAEMIGDKVQTSEAEGLEGGENGWFPKPSAWCRWKLQRDEANHIAQACEAGRVGDGGHQITGMVDARCPPHGQRQTINSGNGRQLKLLEDVYRTS